MKNFSADVFMLYPFYYIHLFSLLLPYSSSSILFPCPTSPFCSPYPFQFYFLSISTIISHLFIFYQYVILLFIIMIDQSEQEQLVFTNFYNSFIEMEEMFEQCSKDLVMVLGEEKSGKSALANLLVENTLQPILKHKFKKAYSCQKGFPINNTPHPSSKKSYLFNAEIQGSKISVCEGHFLATNLDLNNFLLLSKTYKLIQKKSQNLKLILVCEQNTLLNDEKKIILSPFKKMIKFLSYMRKSGIKQTFKQIILVVTKANWEIENYVQILREVHEQNVESDETEKLALSLIESMVKNESICLFKQSANKINQIPQLKKKIKEKTYLKKQHFASQYYIPCKYQENSQIQQSHRSFLRKWLYCQRQILNHLFKGKMENQIQFQKNVSLLVKGYCGKGKKFNNPLPEFKCENKLQFLHKYQNLRRYYCQLQYQYQQKQALRYYLHFYSLILHQISLPIKNLDQIKTIMNCSLFIVENASWYIPTPFFASSIRYQITDLDFGALYYIYKQITQNKGKYDNKVLLQQIHYLLQQEEYLYEEQIKELKLMRKEIKIGEFKQTNKDLLSKTTEKQLFKLASKLIEENGLNVNEEGIQKKIQQQVENLKKMMH